MVYNMDSGAVGPFLTHGGYSSILEATEARIPFVVLPVFGDQNMHALVVADAGLAEAIQKTDSPTVIAGALMKVLQNPTRYLDNANKDGPSFLLFTFFMSTLQILLGLLILLSPLIALKILTKRIRF